MGSTRYLPQQPGLAPWLSPHSLEEGSPGGQCGRWSSAGAGGGSGAPPLGGRPGSPPMLPQGDYNFPLRAGTGGMGLAGRPPLMCLRSSAARLVLGALLIQACHGEAADEGDAEAALACDALAYIGLLGEESFEWLCPGVPMPNITWWGWLTGTSPTPAPSPTAPSPPGPPAEGSDTDTPSWTTALWENARYILWEYWVADSTETEAPEEQGQEPSYWEWFTDPLGSSWRSLQFKTT